MFNCACVRACVLAGGPSDADLFACIPTGVHVNIGACVHGVELVNWLCICFLFTFI